MNIDIHSTRRAQCSFARRSGYTLVEMLLSVVLTLMLMYGVAQIFSMVGESVNDSRALLGIGDRLRATQARLQLDLDGVTSHMTPPARPENNEGYFELIEGPVGPTALVGDRARNTDESPTVEDTTAIDYDDILMFTTRTTTNEPFIGKSVEVRVPVLATEPYVLQKTVESRFAEVAWFVRGRTLYRRVKIVKPDFDINPNTPNVQETLGCEGLYGTDLTIDLTDIENGALGGNGGAGLPLIQDASAGPDKDNRDEAAFENLFDLSVRFECNQADFTDTAAWRWVPNSLADLTKRENRFYHAPVNIAALPFTGRFPFAVHNVDSWRVLGLPTLGETSSFAWAVYQWGQAYYTGGGPELPRMKVATPFILIDRDPSDNLNASLFELDFWNEPYPYDEQDSITGNLTAYEGPRLGEDVILNNVIGFDVKVWDPDAPVLSHNGQILQPGDPGYPDINNPNNPFTNFNTLPAGWAIVSSGAFVDIGYGNGLTMPTGKQCVFAFAPPVKSGLSGSFVYDTWSTHYEFDGIDQNTSIAPNYMDAGFDGIDNFGVDDGVDLDGDSNNANDGNGLVDDPVELDTLPPYPVPLQAIQIKIRVFEPESRQVREVTIVHRFPKR